MTDVVVTVPKRLWAEWLDEGDLPGEVYTGAEYLFTLGGSPPRIAPGERVYVVAHGQLRGYAPLVALEVGTRGYILVRRGNAVAITIPEPIRGFRGCRYRWWERTCETSFPRWRETGKETA